MKQINSLKTTLSTAAHWYTTALLSGLLLASPTSPISAQVEADAVTTTAPGKPVEWRTDLDATLAEAKRQSKLVLLRFTADWCAPCRVMDARIWPDAAVQTALAANYLIVKADIDIESNQQLAREYGVQAVPTLLVLDANGLEKNRGGFMSSAKLIQFLGDAVTTGDESDESADVRT